MSVVALAPPEAPSPRRMTDSERFYELMAWMVRTFECCGACAVELSLAAVEFEGGRELTLTRACPRPDQRGRGCRDRLTFFWQERPKRNQQPKEKP